MEELKKKLSELNTKALAFQNNSKRVTEACRRIGKSWSGSSLVGHAKYFFGNFQEPKTPERFNIEWGLINGVPEGWVEKSDEEVRAEIEKDSNISLDEVKNLAIELENGFTEIQRKIVLHLSQNHYAEPDINKIEKFAIKSATDIFNEIFPTRYMTRDTGSATGTYIAPHYYYDAIARFISEFPNELKGFEFELEKLSPKTQPVEDIPNKNESSQTYYVENSIIVGLSSIKSEQYDLTKLIALCKELNDNYSLGNYLSCGMLIRAILDHIPPIFDKKSFTEVVYNYGTKSFKDIISPLEHSARKISDSYLHNSIQKKEILPTKTQVNFQPNIDVLLSEIIRKLS